MSGPNPKSQSKVFSIYLNVEELILVVVSERITISDLYGGTADSYMIALCFQIVILHNV